MKIVDKRIKEELVAEVGDILVSKDGGYFLITGIVEGQDRCHTIDKTFTLVNLTKNVIVHKDFNSKSVESLVYRFESEWGKTELIKAKDFKLGIN